MKRTVVLAILDGWGIGNPDETNPIHAAHPAAAEEIERSYPAGALQASGNAVGLPWEEEGNSEVGHLVIGAGRVLFQHFPRISESIEDGSFMKTKAFLDAFAHVRDTGGAVHLVGLLSEGNVHAARAHLAALIELAAAEKCAALYLDLFLDGRDSPPQSALKLLEPIRTTIQKSGVGEIATLMGRYFGMDRDRHWERTERAYRALMGDAPAAPTAEACIQASYDRGLTDEYVEPAVIGAPHPIQDGDAVIFFNFREDRMRELSEAFINPGFSEFGTKRFERLFIATMTEYEAKLPAAVAFETERAEYPLARVLAEHGKTQLHIAETEKYAHITYFFNGLTEAPFKNEFRVLVPSQRLARHDEHPEMMAHEVTERVLAALSEGVYDCIVVNYANADIIAHTGNYDAVIQAVRTVDTELGRLAEKVLQDGHVLLVTADHGNAECVIDTQGRIETKHNASPVPCYLVGREYRRATPRTEDTARLPVIGMLSDIAPTVLDLLGVEKPASMTGESLLNQLELQTRAGVQ